jgi:hypothetical protein
MAVVAKGVSPPDLGLWLVSFFASSETRERGSTWPRSRFFGIASFALSPPANLCAFEHIRFETEHPARDQNIARSS